MFFDKFFKKKNKKYTSCQWLEYGMDFDLGVYGSNIKICCYLSAPGGGNTLLIKDYKGEKIDWKEFFKLKNKYRKIQESGKIVPDCEGCVFLETKEWTDENIIYNVIFDHWTHCNCKCTYCYTQDDKKLYNDLKTYNVLPIVREMLEKNILKPGGAIGFGGGEPTMLEEFDELINLLLDKGFSNIRVPSSGLKYSPTIEKGIRSKQLTIVVSIDSGSKEVYQKIKQIDGYDVVTENLKKYAQAQTESGHVITKYIIIPGVNDSTEEIFKWLKFNADNNIKSIVIDIENSWFEKHREQIPQYIYDLIYYTEKTAKELNIPLCDICDRARHMIKEKKID